MPKIKINPTKAVEEAKNHVRAWREKQFASNDIELQNALADSDDAKRTQAINRRDYLRNLPQTCDGKTVDQLKQILVDEGIIE